MSVRYQIARALRAAARRFDRPSKESRRRAAELPQRAAPVTGRTSAPGSRVASLFFERFPRFYLTSSTEASSARLNLRYEAIFGENRDIFDGARVLDIGCHDGRWSLAALEVGAKSVIGIEARPELVTAATENLAAYGYGPDRASFVTGDVHDVLATQDFDVDVVLCLGFLYHTLRYNELFKGIQRTNAKYLIIDTVAPHMMGPTANIKILTEDAYEEGRAAPDAYTSTSNDLVLVGRPNLAAIKTMVGAYGYRVERLSDWAGLLRDNPGSENCGDYAGRTRITIRCVR